MLKILKRLFNFIVISSILITPSYAMGDASTAKTKRPISVLLKKQYPFLEGKSVKTKLIYFAEDVFVKVKIIKNSDDTTYAVLGSLNKPIPKLLLFMLAEKMTDGLYPVNTELKILVNYGPDIINLIIASEVNLIEMGVYKAESK